MYHEQPAYAGYGNAYPPYAPFGCEETYYDDYGYPQHQPGAPTGKAPKEPKQPKPPKGFNTQPDVFHRWTVVAKSRDKASEARANQVLAHHYAGVTSSDPKTLLQDATRFLGGMSGHASNHNPQFEGRHPVHWRYSAPERSTPPKPEKPPKPVKVKPVKQQPLPIYQAPPTPAPAPDPYVPYSIHVNPYVDHYGGQQPGVTSYAPQYPGYY
jgi:hypothetical protein